MHSLSCAVRAGFMQIVIAEGAALPHAASARPSTEKWRRREDCIQRPGTAWAAGVQRLATHRPMAIATENGRGFISFRYRIFEYAADRYSVNRR